VEIDTWLGKCKVDALFDIPEDRKVLLIGMLEKRKQKYEI